MAHRFGPRKGPRKDRSEEPAAAERPAKDLLGSKDLLGEGLLGKDLLGEGLLGKDLPILGKDKGPAEDKDKAGPRRPLPRKMLPQRELPSGGGELPWLYLIGGGIVIIGLIVGLAVGYLNSQVPGYTAEVAVEAPTRLDWVLVASDNGVAGDPPPLWSFFDSTRHSRYERYVPPAYDPAGDQRYPLVLFLSPTEKPVGWSRWAKVCQEHGVIFAGVRDAGRSKPDWQQVRIALDVLDDVRRHYRIDADRCYVAGLGEGGQLACRLAFALPEFFGGVVAIDGASLLPNEIWMRQRSTDRLSVALVTGEASVDRPQIDKLFRRYFQEVGVRSAVWDVPGLADSVPPADKLDEIYRWLEEGVAARQQLAQRYPASRFHSDITPTREQWSKLVFEEAQARLADPKTLYSGVMQLRGVARRWEGMPAAVQAGKLFLDQYLPRHDWPKEEQADRFRHDLPAALALTDYLTKEMPPALLERQWQRNLDWINLATQLWKQVAAISPEHGDQAKKAQEDLDKVFKRPALP